MNDWRDGFEAAALRRRVWNRLWDVGMVMCNRDYDPALDSVQADRAMFQCLDAQSDLVEVGKAIARGRAYRARKLHLRAEAALREAVPLVPLRRGSHSLLSPLNPPAVRRLVEGGSRARG